MKKIQILIMIPILAIFSCNSEPDKSIINYLKVKNNTPYEVVMNFVSQYDYDTILKEHVIKPFNNSFYDTATYTISCDDGCRTTFNNNKTPYWDWYFSNQILVIYDFEGIKISDVQKLNYDGCDTTSGLFPCNYITRDSIVDKLDNGDLNIEITITFHITKQQFLLADSI